MRPPGGPIVDMFNYAHDVDLYWEWANVIVNNRFSEPYTRQYHVCYVGQKHNRTYVHSGEAIMAAFGHCIIHRMAMPSVFRLAMGDYAYLVRTSDLAEMLAAAEFILQM